VERVSDRANAGAVASFEESLTPMLIADDRRRYVGVNTAMCLLLRLDRAAVLRMRVDDLTPPELRGAMEETWDAFLREGVGGGTFELLMPDGPRMEVEYSATANVEPGRHLSIFVVPPTKADVGPEPPTMQRLSVREREVLAMVAMGESGAMIADILGISRATVETHVRKCLAKLEAKNRAHAIALGLQRGELAMDFGSPTILNSED
jgi:DNA-binding CsgD family transcriptional regulator